MRTGICVGVTRLSSIARIRSPACRPAGAAGVPESTWATVVVVSFRERPAHAVERADEFRRFGDRALEVNLEVGRSRPVHAGNLHVAAEWDRTDAVLDPAPSRLHDRGGEPDVELARIHPDGERGEEVPRLVDQDQESQSHDADEQAHATGTSSRARLSASISSCRSRAGEPSTRSRTSSTAAAMSRKPIRPSRNACTATSLAALNAHGY